MEMVIVLFALSMGAALIAKGEVVAAVFGTMFMILGLSAGIMQICTWARDPLKKEIKEKDEIIADLERELDRHNHPEKYSGTAAMLIDHANKMVKWQVEKDLLFTEMFNFIKKGRFVVDGTMAECDKMMDKRQDLLNRAIRFKNPRFPDFLTYDRKGECDTNERRSEEYQN